MLKTTGEVVLRGRFDPITNLCYMPVTRRGGRRQPAGLGLPRQEKTIEYAVIAIAREDIDGALKAYADHDVAACSASHEKPGYGFGAQ